MSYWLAEFGDVPNVEEPPKASKQKQRKPRQDDLSIEEANPFPPGYGEDLLNEQ